MGAQKRDAQITEKVILEPENLVARLSQELQAWSIHKRSLIKQKHWLTRDFLHNMLSGVPPENTSENPQVGFRSKHSGFRTMSDIRTSHQALELSVQALELCLAFSPWIHPGVVRIEGTPYVRPGGSWGRREHCPSVQTSSDKEGGSAVRPSRRVVKRRKGAPSVRPG